MMMDDEVYEAAAGLTKNIPPNKMNEDNLLKSETQGPKSNNNNILHVAAQHGNSTFISTTLPRLTDFGQNSYFALLCQQNSKGETPLHLAVESGDKPTVEELLRAHDHGCDNSVDGMEKKLCWRERDKKGNTPLHRALRCGYEDIAILLLHRDGDLVSFENNACESAAYLAAIGFCLVFLRKILDPKFCGYSFISFSGPRGMTVFHRATKFTDDILSALIQARKELLTKQDDKGKTVLHYAVEENIELTVKKLLTVDKSLARVYDQDSMTPLHKAVSAGFLTVIKTILELSPQSILDATIDGKTALHVAVAKWDACFVRVCLSHTRMKELINVADNQGNTPLHLALSGPINNSQCQLDVVDALLEVYDINWRLENNDGLTPLNLCHWDDKTLLKLKNLPRERRMVKESMELFSRRDQIDLVNRSWDDLLKYRGPFGDTILHMVARDGDTNMMKRAELDSVSDARVRVLLYQQNSRGETPLHMAAAAGKLNIVMTIVSLSVANSSSNVDCDQVEVDILDVHNIELRDQVSTTVQCEPWLVKSENGDTSAHKALRNGHDDVALYLLNLDLNLASDVTDANESLLYLAAQHDCHQVVQRIVSISWADSSSLVFSGPKGRNPLHAATLSAGGVVPEIEDASFINMLKTNIEVITSATSKFKLWVGSLLIDAKPDLSNEVDNHGKTPLHYAAELRQTQVVLKLLEGDKSAAFMYDNEGFTPLLRAVSTAQWLNIHYILKLCPHSIELRHSTSQKTALHLAKVPSRRPLSGCLYYTPERCMKDHAVMSRLINEADAKGNTPLHCAILESDQDKALFLLSARGKRLSIRNHEDKTPLDLCRELLSKEPKQRAIWIAFQSVKVDEDTLRCRSTIMSCIKFLLAHNDLLLCGTDEDLKKLLNNVSVAATLLVTLTFAATFAIPGGYIQDNNSEKNGHAVRICEKAIKLFVASNVVSMMFGIGVLLQYTVGVMRRSTSLGRITLDCLFMLYCAILATLVAFISGVYAIVADEAMWIATLATALSVIMFLFVTLF